MRIASVVFVLGACLASCIVKPVVNTSGDDAEVFGLRAVVRCQQNSPDGEANLRAAPSQQSSILDVLKGTRSLVKIDDVSGPGCDKKWAKLEHDKGYAYACRAILKCYHSQEDDKAEFATPQLTGDIVQCTEKPGVPFVNLRSQPSVFDSRVLAVLDGGASLRWQGTVPAGNGCAGEWYKLAGQTHIVFACSEVVSCQKREKSVLPPPPVLPSVAHGGSRVELDVPYLCQYQSRRGVSEGGALCQVNSFAMAYRYLTGKNLDPDSLAGVRGSYQTPSSMASNARIRFGLRGSYHRYGGSEEDMKRELRAGRPIAVNMCGTWSGHVLLIVGYNAEGWIVNDPAGRWAGNSFNNEKAGCKGFPFDGGVSYPTRCNGKKVVYKYSTFRRAASDSGTTRNYWYTVLAK